MLNVLRRQTLSTTRQFSCKCYTILKKVLSSDAIYSNTQRIWREKLDQKQQRADLRKFVKEQVCFYLIFILCAYCNTSLNRQPTNYFEPVPSPNNRSHPPTTIAKKETMFGVEVDHGQERNNVRCRSRPWSRKKQCFCENLVQKLN